MAASLVEYGMSHSVRPIPENVENFENFAGEGVFGTIDGKDIYIGNRRIGARADSARGDYKTMCLVSEVVLVVFLILNI